MSRLIAALAALLGLGLPAWSQPAWSQPAAAPAEPPGAVIYIGNSFFYYNNGIHGQVTQLQRAAGLRPFRATLVGIGGSGFDWHDVNSYFRPNALGRYGFDQNNNVVMNPPRTPLFDVAIMMDCSQCPIHPQLSPVFHEFARRHSETIRSHGARPALFMSWANKNRPEMTAPLAEAYTAAGRANNALVIPAGLAFARAMAERPQVNLHHADLRHPSPAGTYLAAATIFASLHGRSPEGNSFHAGLDAETAAFLQRIAWETVRDYQATQRAAN